MDFHKYYLKNNLDLTNKTIIVTGANSGIGFSIVKHLVRLNAKVVMACRSKQRCEAAITEIKNEYPNADLSFLYFDQSTFETSKESIEGLINSTFINFDGFIFNAGVLSPKDNNLNEDGFPITIAINYINLVYMVEKLMPHLNEDKEIRFVFQSSLTSRMYKKYKYLLNNNLSKFNQYSLSKYAVTNYKNYKVNTSNSNIKFLVSEPGITNSNIICSFPKVLRSLGNWFMKTFMLNVDKASLNAVMCVAKNDINSGDEYRPGGIFSINGKPKRITKKVKYNKELINITKELIDD